MLLVATYISIVLVSGIAATTVVIIVRRNETEIKTNTYHSNYGSTHHNSKLQALGAYLQEPKQPVPRHRSDRPPGCHVLRPRQSVAVRLCFAWRLMGSYKRSYKSPSMGYNYSYLTYNPT